MSFQIGNLMCTAAINAAMHEPDSSFELEVREAIAKYLGRDWGLCSKDDWSANDMAIKYGDRVMGSYQTSQGTVWIITEADRSYTTILFPSDY